MTLDREPRRARAHSLVNPATIILVCAIGLVFLGLTILFSAFGSILGMLFFNRLPRLHHPLLKHRSFALASHDRYFLVVETADPKYSESETRKLLESTGSQRIELVED